MELMLQVEEKVFIYCCVHCMQVVFLQGRPKHLSLRCKSLRIIIYKRKQSARVATYLEYQDFKFKKLKKWKKKSISTIVTIAPTWLLQLLLQLSIIKQYDCQVLSFKIALQQMLYLSVYAFRTTVISNSVSIFKGHRSN